MTLVAGDSGHRLIVVAATVQPGALADSTRPPQESPRNGSEARNREFEWGTLESSVPRSDGKSTFVEFRAQAIEIADEAGAVRSQQIVAIHALVDRRR